MVQRSVTAPIPAYAPREGPVWAGWVYLGLAALAGAQLLAAVLQAPAGAPEPELVSSLVGVVAFPALAATAFLRGRRPARPHDRAGSRR
ncbi:hypothetical protein [Streptomyces sp. NPDC048650]|uniref:hypothetical protein n=1 Tax=unclassified Streptomyces TaxID=2593676 RepID=UPI003713B78D